MKILHVNTLSNGGAFNAALRLHQGLLKQGIDSSFLTLAPRNENIENQIVFPKSSKYHSTFSSKVKHKLRIAPLNSLKRNLDLKSINSSIEYFSAPFSDYRVAKFINEQLDVDIINLHWASNFIDYTEFFGNIKKPVVWTLHDENPISSYWHYSLDHINNPEALLIHEKYLKIKKAALRGKHIDVVSPSNWLMNESKKSELFKSYPHLNIPYGIDTSIFKRTLEIPQSVRTKNKEKKEIIGLFICQNIDNARKGMTLLIESITQFQIDQRITFIAVGKVTAEMKKLLPSNIIMTGEIIDHNELVRLYNYADFTLIPSLKDNLPNTLLESLCCGTPVVGTPAGGIRDILSNSCFGLLSHDFKPKSFNKTINNFVTNLNDFNPDKISIEAQNSFKLSIQADAYLKIYENILE